MEKLEVWLDDIVIKELVGFLYQQNNQFWFEYSTNWLEFKNNFVIDPNLPLIKGSFYADKGENFGIFNDSSPDRWGRNLIKPLNDYAKIFVKINTISKKTKPPHP